MSPLPAWLKQTGTFLQKWYLFLSCSPLLARLEKKCQSKEEITEEDFASEEGIMGNKVVIMGNKVPKLTEDWCEEVAKEENKEEENIKESQAEEPMEEDSNAKDDAEEKPEHGSVPYFRSNAKL